MYRQTSYQRSSLLKRSQRTSEHTGIIPKASTVCVPCGAHQTHPLNSVELPARACLQLTLHRHLQRSSVPYSPRERAQLTAEMPAQQQGGNSATLHFTPWLFTSPSVPEANLLSLLGSSTQPLQKASVSSSFPPSLPSFRLKAVLAKHTSMDCRMKGFHTSTQHLREACQVRNISAQENSLVTDVPH